MVRHPKEYRWSSYHANGLGRSDPLLTPQQQYLRLGRSAPERLAAYRELFKAHMEPEMLDEIRSATNGGYVLGDERFQQEIAAMLGRRVARGTAGRPCREAVADEQLRLL
jgi:putative transposase